VVVASAYEPDGGCAFAKMKKGCTALANVRETLTTPTPGNATYYVSKFLQSLHAAMIAAQERTLSTGVEAFAYAPGVVYTPLAKLGLPYKYMVLNLARPVCVDHRPLGNESRVARAQWFEDKPMRGMRSTNKVQI